MIDDRVRRSIVTSPVKTINAYHLGDNQIHLNWFRKVAMNQQHREFVHYCREEHIPQLLDLIEDVPNIALRPVAEACPDAVNSWINADEHYNLEPHRRDWVYLHLQHFRRLARKLGIDNPATSREHLLFSHPALLRNNVLTKPVDFLVINSRPLSGQFRNFSAAGFVELVRRLIDQGHSVVTVEPTGLCPSTIEFNFNVSQIGAVSRYCRYLLAVNTGPLWPTFNVWNRNTIELRIIYCTIHNFPLTENVVSCNAMDYTLPLLRHHTEA